MSYFLAFRVHTDALMGLGHVARALAIQEAWLALGGRSILCVSGDHRARRIGSGLHPFLDQSLPSPALDLGENPNACLPEALKAELDGVLVDLWEPQPSLIDCLRPLKIAFYEDDSEIHEAADLLFQPYLDGVSFGDHPIRQQQGKRLRPFEDYHGSCRVIRGSRVIIVDRNALVKRPRQEPQQPLAVHKLLVTFGGSDGTGLAQKAFQVLEEMVLDHRWVGSCTILDPAGVLGKPFPGCSIHENLPELTRRLPEFDAVWCSAGVTLAECQCMGIPVATWGQNERQHRVLADLAQSNGCYHLGIGPEADLVNVARALEVWLGPEGQDNRQEQCRDGMKLVDGQGAGRVAQELMGLLKG